MTRKKDKRNLCTEQISFRCTKYEKRKIKRFAEKEGMQQKELIMKGIECLEKTKKKEINQVACACEVQALVNYLRRNHQDDDYIMEVGERLWDIVN